MKCVVYVLCYHELECQRQILSLLVVFSWESVSDAPSLYCASKMNVCSLALSWQLCLFWQIIVWWMTSCLRHQCICSQIVGLAWVMLTDNQGEKDMARVGGVVLNLIKHQYLHPSTCDISCDEVVISFDINTVKLSAWRKNVPVNNKSELFCTASER